MKDIRVLLVEDKESDARLVREAFKERKLNYAIDLVKDGVEAMDFLLKRGKFKEAQIPQLIILDIKLPKKDGKDVLKEIKSSISLKDIPVVMLTNSDTSTDILESYEHQANSYITKPLAMKDLIEIVKYIEETWLSKL